MIFNSTVQKRNREKKVIEKKYTQEKDREKSTEIHKEIKE